MIGRWLLAAVLVAGTILVLAGCALPHRGPGYGAVAYSPTTRDWQLHWQASTPGQARLQALTDCPADDCRVVMEFGPGQCATLSLGQPGFGTGQGATPAQAETEALAACAREGQNCRVAQAECNL